MREVIKAYWSSGMFRAGAILAVLFALGSALVAMNNAIDSATSIWKNIEILYARAATPWLGFFMLLAVTGMAAWGYKDVVAAQEKGNLVDQAAAREEANRAIEARQEAIAAQRRFVKLPYLMTKAFVHSQEVFALEREIGRVEQQLATLTRQLEPWLGDDRIDIRNHIDAPVDVAHYFRMPGGLNFHATSFDVPAWRPHWTEDRPQIVMEAAPQRHQRAQQYFDPQANRAYQTAQRVNLDTVHKRLAEIKAIAERERQQLVHYQRAVQQELEVNGIG